MKKTTEDTPIWEIIQREFINLDKESVVKKEFSNMILSKYPHIKKGTLSAQIAIQVINKRARTGYFQCGKERVCGDNKFDFLFEQEDKTLCKYDKLKHGTWEIYKRDDGKLDVRIISNPSVGHTKAEGDNEKNISKEITIAMLGEGYTGKGKFTAPDGTVYIGEFRKGKYNNQGTLTYTDGENYKGEWKDGNIHGKGTYTFATGDKYVGEFIDGVKNGKGIYTHGKGEWEGDVYVGEFKDDNRNGKGTLTMGKGEWEGDKYAGEWKDGKKDGQGTYTYTDGKSFNGEWKNGVLTEDIVELHTSPKEALLLEQVSCEDDTDEVIFNVITYFENNKMKPSERIALTKKILDITPDAQLAAEIAGVLISLGQSDFAFALIAHKDIYSGDDWSYERFDEIKNRLIKVKNSDKSEDETVDKLTKNKDKEDLQSLQDIQKKELDRRATLSQEERDKEDQEDDEDDEKFYPALTVRVFKDENGEKDSETQELVSKYMLNWQETTETYSWRAGITARIPDFFNSINEKCPKWTDKEIQNINTFITKYKVIPSVGFRDGGFIPEEFLNFTKQVWWLVPFVIWKDEVASWVFIDKNGFYAPHPSDNDAALIFNWDIISGMDIEWEEDNLVTLTVSGEHNDSDIELTFSEFVAEGMGSYLSVIESIYNIYQKTIEVSDHCWYHGAGGEGYQGFETKEELLDEKIWKAVKATDPAFYGYVEEK